MSRTQTRWSEREAVHRHNHETRGVHIPIEQPYRLPFRPEWRRKKQRGGRWYVGEISRFFLNQRIEFGEVVEVFEEGNEVKDEEDAPNAESDVIH